MREPQTAYLETGRETFDAVRKWRAAVEAELQNALDGGSSGPAPRLPELWSKRATRDDGFREVAVQSLLLADPGLRLLVASHVARASVALGVPRGSARAVGAEEEPTKNAVLEILARSDHELAAGLAGEGGGLSTACDLVAGAIVQDLWPGSCLRGRDRDAIDVARCLVLRSELPKEVWPDHEAVRGLLQHPWFRGVRRRVARNSARQLVVGASVPWRPALDWPYSSVPPDGLVAMAIEFHGVVARAPCSEDLKARVESHIENLVRRSDSEAMGFWWTKTISEEIGVEVGSRDDARQLQSVHGALPLRQALPFDDDGDS